MKSLEYYLEKLNLTVEDASTMSNGDLQGIVECMFGYGIESDVCLNVIRDAIEKEVMKNVQ